jgi:hypothetical protein
MANLLLAATSTQWIAGQLWIDFISLRKPFRLLQIAAVICGC